MDETKIHVIVVDSFYAAEIDFKNQMKSFNKPSMHGEFKDGRKFRFLYILHSWKVVGWKIRSYEFHGNAKLHPRAAELEAILRGRMA